MPDLTDELFGTARLYQRVAYAQDLPAPGSLDVLQQLWSELKRS